MPFSTVSRMRFSRQLTTIVSVAIFGLALFSSLTTSYEASRRMKSYLIEQGQQIAQNLAGQSTLALLYHSADNAETALKTTLAFPDVLQVRILDANGKVLASQVKGNTPAQARTLPQGDSTPTPAQWETGEELYFAVPVHSEPSQNSPFEVDEPKQTLLGSVQVVVGKGSLNRLVFSLFVGNLLVTLAFASLLLWLIQRATGQLMRPLVDLSQLMHRAENGESNMRAKPEGPRDIAEMGIAFNKMMDVLEEREFPIAELRFFASARSAGTTLPFRGEEARLVARLVVVVAAVVRPERVVEERRQRCGDDHVRGGHRWFPRRSALVAVRWWLFVMRSSCGRAPIPAIRR